MTESRQDHDKIATIEERLEQWQLQESFQTWANDPEHVTDQADAFKSAIVNDWRYALDALNIEIRTRTIRHRNGTLFCINCKEYHKNGHAPGCSVGMCIKARDKLSGRTE